MFGDPYYRVQNNRYYKYDELLNYIMVRGMRRNENKILNYPKWFIELIIWSIIVMELQKHYMDMKITLTKQKKCYHIKIWLFIPI